LNSEHPKVRTRKPLRAAAIAACAAAALALPATALAGGGGIGTQQTTSGDKAKLKANGKAIAPASAPRAVKRAIDAANEIDKYPYKSGGGHGTWRDNGYDCSGAVSYVLGPKGARLIDRTMVSGDFARWGGKGKGNWITTYGDAGHVFVVIAGLRFDTSQPDDGRSGPGWSKDVRKGFVNVSKSAARHKGKL
jgi:cell wall-associated NlpC family hydrolase